MAIIGQKTGFFFTLKNSESMNGLHLKLKKRSVYVCHQERS